MATTLVDRTFVAIGHAQQADAFQRGREAAQTAKSQLRSGSPNLVLTFGPDNVHFKDLIEGVRLVTGEETLVGIPVQRVISKDACSPEASIVLAIQSPEMNFAIGAVPVMPGQFSAVTTSALSQIRSSRGNIRKQFSDQGLLVFDNTPEKLSMDTHRLMAAEAGLTTWSLGARPRISQTIPLICGDRNISEGLVAIECLSASPWGIGEVVLEEFIGQGSAIYLNAIKSALRNALAGMTSAPSFGLLFLNFPIDELPTTITDAFFETAGSIIGDVPFVGLATDHLLIQGSDRAMTLKNHSITVLLGPQ